MCRATKAASWRTPSMKFESRRCWKRWPTHVEAVDRRDAAALGDLAGAVEDGQRAARVVAAGSRSPRRPWRCRGVRRSSDGGGATDGRRPRRWSAASTSASSPCARGVRVDLGRAGGARRWSAAAASSRQVVGEADAGCRRSRSAGPSRSTPRRWSAARSTSRWSSRPTSCTAPSRRAPVGSLTSSIVVDERADALEPPPDVHAAVAARQRGCGARRRARRRARRGRARRRAARRWPTRRRRARRRREVVGRAGRCRRSAGRHRAVSPTRTPARAATSHHPVASTTLRACHVAESVAHGEPRRRRVIERTALSCSIGAANEAA